MQRERQRFRYRGRTTSETTTQPGITPTLARHLPHLRRRTQRREPHPLRRVPTGSPNRAARWLLRSRTRSARATPSRRPRPSTRRRGCAEARSDDREAKAELREWEQRYGKLVDRSVFDARSCRRSGTCPERRVKATGLSLRNLTIRRGERVPHPRHWHVLRAAALLHNMPRFVSWYGIGLRMWRLGGVAATAKRRRRAVSRSRRRTTQIG